MKLTTELKQQIEAMTHEELCGRWRFAPIGDPFWEGDSGDYAAQRLKALGGFTPEMSKRLGWG